MTPERDRAGWLLFGGFLVTKLSVSGISLSFIGAGWFSYIKLMERAAPKAPAGSSTVSPVKDDGTQRSSDTSGNSSEEISDDNGRPQSPRPQQATPTRAVSPSASDDQAASNADAGKRSDLKLSPMSLQKQKSTKTRTPRG